MLATYYLNVLLVFDKSLYTRFLNKTNFPHLKRDFNEEKFKALEEKKQNALEMEEEKD